MEQNKDENISQTCGPDCSCNKKKVLPRSLKIVLLLIIILVAGSVLANSLLIKSRAVKNRPVNNYASVLASNTNSSVSPSRKNESSGNGSAMPVVTLSTLFSFASLDTIAKQYDGVFVLVENKEDDKSTSRINELSQAANSIGTRGMNIGIFQLHHASPDFQMVSSQLAPPCALVLIKGRGMRGVDSANLNQQRLIQASLAAMQPTSCCPAGGKKVCK
jgi:hypothetical protein